MHRILVVAVLWLAAVASSASALKDEVASAEAAAESWLIAQDSRNYAASWEQASALLRAGVAAPDWIAALDRSRTPFGTVKSRRLESAQFFESLPSAPPGEYVVIRYATEFESGRRAIETITPAKEPDGTWKVSGYYIR